MQNVMAHAQKPDFVFPRNGRFHLNRWGRQFSRLLAADVCASAWVMLDRPCSEVAWEYRLPTQFASFPFTSPPVHHRVPSGSAQALPTLNLYFSLWKWSTRIKSRYHQHFTKVTFLYLHLFKIVAWNVESIVNSSGYKISFEQQPRFPDRKCNSCKCVVEWLSSKLQHSGNDILLSDDQILKERLTLLIQHIELFLVCIVAVSCWKRYMVSYDQTGTHRDWLIHFALILHHTPNIT